MGAMGRYIDALSETQRDRVLTAQAWTEDGGSFVDEHGCRCLCGHAENWFRNEEGHSMARDFGGYLVRPHTLDGTPVYNVYPKAVNRFGIDRVVRAVKKRAARAGATSPEAIAALTEQPRSRAVR